jgi:hypothetical protein
MTIDDDAVRKLAPRAPRVEVPRLARLRHAPLVCAICTAPLLDQDLVTWHESEGWRSATYHARCTIFIMSNDRAVVRRLDGSEIPRDAAGGFDAPPGGILLTEDEWKAWLATEDSRPAHVRRGGEG